MKLPFRKITDGVALCREYYLHGRERHANALFDKYYLLLAGLCNSFLKDSDAARSLAVDVFQKFLKTARETEILNPQAWLYRAGRDASLKYLRDNRKYIFSAEVPEAPVQETDDVNLSPDRTLLLERFMPELPENQQVTITLFYLEGLSYQQICEQTGYTFMQVKSFIQNGKRNLRLMIEKHEKAATGS